MLTCFKDLRCEENGVRPMPQADQRTSNSSVRRFYLANLIFMALVCVLPLETQAKDGMGVVAIRLVGNGYLPKQLTLKSLSSGQSIQLPVVRQAVFSSTVFGGSVAEGRYTLEKLLVAGASAGVPVEPDPSRSIFEGDLEGPVGGEFEVTASRVTNLGTLIYLPVGDPVKTQSFFKPVPRQTGFSFVVDPTRAPTNTIAFMEPQRESVPTDELSWSAAPGVTAGTVVGKALIEEAAKRFPVLWGATVGAVSDTFFAGGRMGQVITVDASGLRKRLQTGSVHEIHAVHELDDGRWLAGGEEGYLTFSDDRGQTWSRVKSIEPHGLVMHITHSKRGKVYVASQLDDGVVVHSTDKHLQRWVEVFRTPITPASRYSNTNPPEALFSLRDSVSSTAQRLVIYARDAKLHSMDFESETWQSEESGANHKGISTSVDGLVIGSIFVGVKRGTLDYGKTWYKLESFTWAGQPLFSDRLNGAMVGSPLKFTYPHRDWTLYNTSDGGVSWSAVQTVDLEGVMWSYGALRWMNKAMNIVAIIYPPQGMLMISRDGGRTWTKSAANQ